MYASGSDGNGIEIDWDSSIVSPDCGSSMKTGGSFNNYSWKVDTAH